MRTFATTLCRLAIAFVALTAASDPQPSYFTESFEGERPSIDRYGLSGSFDGGRARFSLALDRTGTGWTGTVAGLSARPIRFRLAGNLPPQIMVNRIAIARRSQSARDDTFLIVVPFGPPQNACFVNGESVHQNITISVRRNGELGAERLAFPNCSPTYSRLPLRIDRGVSVIE